MNPQRHQEWDIHGKLVVDEIIPWTSEQVLSLLKATRDSHWGGGCWLGKSRLQTDPESIGNLSGAYQFGKEFDTKETPFTLTWSLGGGHSIELDLPTLRLACGAVMQHVQACNARYLELYGEINAGRELDEVLNDLETGWPE